MASNTQRKCIFIIKFHPIMEIILLCLSGYISSSGNKLIHYWAFHYPPQNFVNFRDQGLDQTSLLLRSVLIPVALSLMMILYLKVIEGSV